MPVSTNEPSLPPPDAERFLDQIVHTEKGPLAKGIRQLKAKDYAGAVESLSAAAAENPDSNWPAYYLGVAWLEQDQIGKAVSQFNAAVRLAPQHPQAWFYRGVCRRKQHQPRKALQDLQKAAELGYGDFPLLLERASVELELDLFQEAAERATEALTLDPRSAEALFVRCLARVQLHQSSKARQDLAQARQLGLREDLAATALKAVESSEKADEARKQLD